MWKCSNKECNFNSPIILEKCDECGSDMEHICKKCGKKLENASQDSCGNCETKRKSKFKNAIETIGILAITGVVFGISLIVNNKKDS